MIIHYYLRFLKKGKQNVCTHSLVSHFNGLSRDIVKKQDDLKEEEKCLEGTRKMLMSHQKEITLAEGGLEKNTSCSRTLAFRALFSSSSSRS